MNLSYSFLNTSTTMVNSCRDLDDNSGIVPPSRLPLATRAISCPVRGPRRSNDYMVLSVPVRLNGDGNNMSENDEQSRFDGLLQVQQRLERHVTHIRNQQTRLNDRIASLNQYLVSMDANMRSIAQHSVCVEQHIRTILRCLTSWSRYVHPDGHVRDFGRLCAAIAGMNNSINFGDDTDNDSD